MSDDRSANPELKARIFEAFEHACRYGEVEVADTLLAIINNKWMKPAQPPMPGLALRSMPGSTGPRLDLQAPAQAGIPGRHPAAGRNPAGRTYMASR